jgi:hypothetical protein
VRLFLSVFLRIQAALLGRGPRQAGRPVLLRIFLGIQPVLLLVPAPALAQFTPLGSGSYYFSPPSHQDDPDQTPLPTNIAPLLDAPRRNVKPPTVANLLEQMKKMGLDPQKLDDKSIKELLEQNPALKDPKNIEYLQNFIKSNSNNLIGPDEWKKLLGGLDNKIDQLTPVPNSQPNNSINPTPPGGNPVAPHSLPQTSPGPVERSKPIKDPQAEQFVQWVSRNFADSSLSQDLLKDFGKMMNEEAAPAERANFLESMQNEWKSMMGSTDGDSSPKWGDLFSNLKLPDLAPTGSSNDHAAASGSGNNTRSSGSGAGVEFGWAELLLIVLLAAGILIGYKLRGRKNRQPSAISTTFEERAPVDAQTILTREDVVRAFDSLSVARCGAEAANWNHRQIAHELGMKLPERHDAVDRLAGLYEKARYAPAHELFTEVEVVEARARLSQVVEANE